MKKLFIGLFLLVSVAWIGIGCDSNSGQVEDAKKLALVGSTSVSPLIEKEVAVFEQDNSGYKVDVQSVGSSAGIKAVLDGVADVGMSSRDLKEEEKEKLDETVIALDAIAVVVNEKNGVKAISKENLKKVFTGEITNWSQLGGADKAIVVVNREEGSGTRTAFEELVALQEEKDGHTVSMITDTAVIADGNGSVKQNVATKENAIGYLSLGVVDTSIKSLNIDGIEASETNVKDKKYDLYRSFLLVTPKGASGDSKAFIDFILSDAGQAIVADNHYISVN